MTRLLLILVLIVAFAAACGGDDDAPSPSGTGTPSATVNPLGEKLTTVLLQQSEVPEGLQSGGLAYSPNESLAQTNEQLQQIIATGRQYGVEITFVPTDNLPETNPVRGGIQNSASVYSDPAGASQTFLETVAQARTNNWAANYPDLEGVTATEMPRQIGDESLWLRVSGLAQCEVAQTVTPGPDGVVPSIVCVKKRAVVDYVIYRVGRVRAYLQVTSLFPADSPEDVYASEIESWANLVKDRATAAFPSAGG